MECVNSTDRRIIRDLAHRIAEIASLPTQAERIRLWKALNGLRPERPVIVVGAASNEEICPKSTLQCEDEGLRVLECYLRLKIARHELAHDDYPITDVYKVGWVIRNSGHGLEETYSRRDSGGFSWDPPIKEYSDLKRLRPAEIQVDREASDRRLELMRELMGDILDVQRGGNSQHGGNGTGFFRAKLTRKLILLRGLEQFMLDMYDAPQFLHELMSFLQTEMIKEIEYYERESLFCLNNGPEDWTDCGGMATNDELPADGFDPDHVRMEDMFVWGESQESVGIGADLYEEFVLSYQLPILNRFGLVAYGCCEPQDNWIDLLIRRVPKLRWVAVPPWSDRELMAEKLQNRYVYCCKPQPSRICQPKPDYESAERELRETLRITKGCCVAIDLKDANNLCGEPHRLTRWTDIAQQVVAEMN